MRAPRWSIKPTGSGTAAPSSYISFVLHRQKESPAAKVSSISVLFFVAQKKANIVSPAVIGKIEQDMSRSEHELTLALVKHTRNVNEYELYFRES